ncbi:MAG: polysaccharide deacetylase family protein [Eggerthellaceae bacterium]|nr:polysaccharide deacetylase family protein [Eggerthellaceae bacterium]
MKSCEAHLAGAAAVVFIATIVFAALLGCSSGNGEPSQNNTPSASTEQAAGAAGTQDSSATEQEAVSDTAAPAGAGQQGASQAQEDAPGSGNSVATSSGAQGVAHADATALAWRDGDFPVGARDQVGSNKDNGRKVVYLTIDDGPSPRTPEVLDILDRYGCKATFFVVGHNPDSYHYIKEAYDRGHTIGLHTFSHDYEQVYASTDAYFADLDQIGKVVADQIGYVPCFIRFPGGSSNGISANYCPGIMTVLVDAVQARGYQYYDWDASFGDGAEHTTEELVGYVKEASPETNIVLLCHDSEGKQTTVEALPQVIEHFQGLGYTFEAIDRNTWTPHHGVNN